jgi:predicted nucleic-acid-binding protein
VKITADTNVLIRAITGDDPEQSRLACAALAQASLVAVPLPALCELAWVLARGYRLAAPDIARAIRGLADAAEVALNRPAVMAGLAM